MGDLLPLLKNAGLTIIEILIIMGLTYWCSILHKATKSLTEKVNELMIDKNATKVHLHNICKKLDYIIQRIDKFDENKLMGGYN